MLDNSSKGQANGQLRPSYLMLQIRLDDFLEELERLDPAEATEDQALVRSSLKDMPLASTIQEIQLGLFLSQVPPLVQCVSASYWMYYRERCSSAAAESAVQKCETV